MHHECHSHIPSKIRYDGIGLLCFYCFNETSSPMLDKTIRWSISILNLAICVHHRPCLENPCQFFTPAEGISKWASYSQVLKVSFWKLTLALEPRLPAEIRPEADVCWQTRQSLLSEVMCARAVWRASVKPPQSFRHLHYHHNINVWKKKTEECRLLTFCFVLSSITVEHFFSLQH